MEEYNLNEIKFNNKVEEEIITTEFHYVSQIRKLIEVFVAPLLEFSGFPNQIRHTIKQLQKETEATYAKFQNKFGAKDENKRNNRAFFIPEIQPKMAIFLSNIEQIYCLNLMLLKDLIRCCNTGRCLSEVFKRYADLFLIYAQFAKSYQYAIMQIAESEELGDYIAMRTLAFADKLETLSERLLK